MNHPKIKNIRLSLLLFLCLLISQITVQAQAMESAVEKTEQEIKEEQEVKRAEKMAKIEEKRKKAKMKNQKYMASQKEMSRKMDEEMFAYVDMKKEQIEKYNKLTEKTREKTKKIMQKGKTDPAVMREEIQKIRDGRSAELKKIFSSAQFDKYMEFNEMKASKNSKSKNNNVVKKVN